MTADLLIKNSVCYVKVVTRIEGYCYNIVQNPVQIHDLNATILQCLGVDHQRLTFRFQGCDFRLTDVHGDVVKDLLV